MANKTITFGADLLPNSTSEEYSLGSATQKWSIFGDVSGNADTATELATARTLWGQSFSGTANVTGNLIDVGDQLKLLSGKSVLQFLTSTGGAAQGKFGKIGINGSYANIDLTNYVLDVGGATRISGITSFTNNTASTSTSTGAVKITGGLGVGEQITALRVGINGSNTSYSLYVNGSAYFNNSVTFANKAFNYSAMENATTDTSRNIWFSDSSIRGKPVYNDNFKYNPNKAQLTINSAILESLTTTSANTAAWSILTLGNNANVSTSTAHSEGKIVLYSAATQAHTIVGQSTTTAYTHTLPNSEGMLLDENNWQQICGIEILRSTTAMAATT